MSLGSIKQKNDIILQLCFSILYQRMFGGVTLFTPEEFRKINGYSDEYWGWGGEDDDMIGR